MRLYNVKKIPKTNIHKHFTEQQNIIIDCLPYLFLMHPFSTLLKYQKTLRFSDVFRGYKKGALCMNGLINLTSNI